MKNDVSLDFCIWGFDDITPDYVTDGRAMPYNPAWLSNLTIANFGLDPEKGNIQKLISNDVLNSIQITSESFSGLQHPGHDNSITNLKPSVLLNPIKAYMIDSFLDGWFVR